MQLAYSYIYMKSCCSCSFRVAHGSEWQGTLSGVNKTTVIYMFEFIPPKYQVWIIHVNKIRSKLSCWLNWLTRKVSRDSHYTHHTGAMLTKEWHSGTQVTTEQTWQSVMPLNNAHEGETLLIEQYVPIWGRNPAQCIENGDDVHHPVGAA